MLQVLNMKDKGIDDFWTLDNTEHIVRIDRVTKWGNPFIMGIDGDRDEVCNKYWVWLHEWMLNGKEIKLRIGAREYSNKWVIEHISELKGKNVACWCSPERCHGHLLVELANKE